MEETDRLRATINARYEAALAADSSPLAASLPLDRPPPSLPSFSAPTPAEPGRNPPPWERALEERLGALALLPPTPAAKPAEDKEEAWDVMGWEGHKVQQQQQQQQQQQHGPGRGSQVDLMSASPDEIAAAAEARRQGLYGPPLCPPSTSAGGGGGDGLRAGGYASTAFILPRASYSTLQVGG